MQDFRQLQVWSDSVDLCVDIYRTTSDFGSDVRFGLTSQIRRAAVSISSNIAEGASRSSPADFARFIGYAVASASEVESQLEISSRLAFLSPDHAKELLGRVMTLRKRLIRLMYAVESRS